jgi:hypothetical protein
MSNTLGTLPYDPVSGCISDYQQFVDMLDHQREMSSRNVIRNNLVDEWASRPIRPAQVLNPDWLKRWKR